MHSKRTNPVLWLALGLVTLAILAARAPAQPSSKPDDWNVFPTVPLVDVPNALPNSPTLLKSLGDAAEFVTRWKPPVNVGAWQQRRPIVERAFRRAIGLEKLPERTPLNARVVVTNIFDDYLVENVLFESRPGFPVTANLYRPTAPANGRRPAVLSPIGHFLTPGKTAPEVQARCLKLAKLGFIVLAYDAIGQGERMTPGNIHHDAGYALLPLGETIAGWMVWDSMRAIDYLLTRDDVDATRLGITGNSGGGLNTLFAAALDERLHAAAIVGFTFEFGNWLKYGGAHCTCTHLPGVFREMEWFEIAGLIAPRAVMMIQGGNDGIFPISGARRSGANVEHIYQLLGHADRARLVELPGLPHAYSRPYRESMCGWMTWRLQGQGHGEPAAEGDIQTLPEKDPRLLCDPERSFMPRAPTVVDLARKRALERVSEPPDVNTPETRESVLKWVRDLTTPAEPKLHLLSARTHRKTTVPGGALEKISFNSEDGQRLPGLLWLPDKSSSPGQTILIADERGKAAVAESGLVKPLLAAGYAVLAVDLRGRGETLGRYGPNYDTNFRLVANQVLFGQPLAGRRAFDLTRALDCLAARQGLASNSVTVVSLGDDALPALLAAATDPRIHQIVLAGYLHSFISQMRARTPPLLARMGETWNNPQLQGRVNTGDYEVDFGSVIPSALDHADVSDLTALIAPRRVLFCQARDNQAPDLEALASRFQRVVESAGGNWLSYAPEQMLDGRLLVEWLEQKDKP
jgi:cephalosporin-C deacetylase-like acetyl esterase